MKITEKDMLLSDYMEGHISEEELIARYPELSIDVELIKLSQNALSNLEFPSPELTIQIPESLSISSFTLKKAWYIFATVLMLIIIALGLYKFYNNKMAPIEYAEILQGDNTEEKVIALGNMWQKDQISTDEQMQLLQVALNDDNSNVRYMALQLLSEQSMTLDQPELYQYIEREKSLNNQTAWIELWVKMHDNKSDLLGQWLNQKHVHPIVRDFGIGAINNI